MLERKNCLSSSGPHLAKLDGLIPRVLGKKRGKRGRLGTCPLPQGCGKEAHHGRRRGNPERSEAFALPPPREKTTIRGACTNVGSPRQRGYHTEGLPSILHPLRVRFVQALHSKQWAYDGVPRWPVAAASTLPWARKSCV